MQGSQLFIGRLSAFSPAIGRSPVAAPPPQPCSSTARRGLGGAGWSTKPQRRGFGKSRERRRHPPGMFPSGPPKAGQRGLAANAGGRLRLAVSGRRPRPLAAAAGEARAGVCGGPSQARAGRRRGSGECPQPARCRRPVWGWVQRRPSGRGDPADRARRGRLRGRGWRSRLGAGMPQTPSQRDNSLPAGGRGQAPPAAGQGSPAVPLPFFPYLDRPGSGGDRRGSVFLTLPGVPFQSWGGGLGEDQVWMRR